MEQEAGRCPVPEERNNGGYEVHAGEGDGHDKSSELQEAADDGRRKKSIVDPVILGTMLEDTQDLFMLYLELVFNVPDRADRLFNQAVSVTPLVPPAKDSSGDFKHYELISEAEVPPPTNDMEAMEEDNVFIEDLSMQFQFNGYSGVWDVFFCPSDDIGFTVSGSDLIEVFSQIQINLESRIDILVGNLDLDMDEVDKEWEAYHRGVDMGG